MGVPKELCSSHAESTTLGGGSPRVGSEAEKAPRDPGTGYANAWPTRAPAHPPAQHAAWAPAAREGARAPQPARRSPSTTAATVESSSQLFFRKRLWSHPFFASFLMAGGRARRRGRGYICARRSAVRVGPEDRRRFRGAVAAGCGSVGERLCAGRCGRRCHRRCHLRSRAAPSARSICVAGAPGSSRRRRVVRRAYQPARKEGGARERGGGRCVWCARRPAGTSVGARPALRLEPGRPLRDPAPRPAFCWSVSLFFFLLLFFFLNWSG